MKGQLDKILLFLIFAIGSISLLTIFSINRGLAENQAVFWVIGTLIMLFVATANYQTLQKISFPLYFFSILCLILVLFFTNPVRGSVRWIDFGPFRFQPSELAKIATILLLANFYIERSTRQLKNIIISFLIVLPFIILVLLQPDIGNALVFIAIWLGISFACGFRFKSILLLALFGLVVIVAFYQILAPYQKQRIESFINPSADPLRTGYNIIQSKIAVGSGELFGKGLGRGSQSQLNFLPEAESDFIFASLVEQLGFLGGSLLIALFLGILLRILSFAKKVDRPEQLILIGCLSFFMLQISVNIGMNLAILPVTGITLPLVSYGGSSLISTLLLLGIVLSVAKRQRKY